MADDISLTADDELQNAIAGKGNTQQTNRQRIDPQQTVRSDIHFTNPDNLQLYLYLTSMNQDIRDLIVKMDNLPARVNSLEMAGLEVARTAVEAAKAASVLAAQTAAAAAHLAATKSSAPLATWLIICLLVVIAGTGMFYVGMQF